MAGVPSSTDRNWFPTEVCRRKSQMGTCRNGTNLRDFDDVIVLNLSAESVGLALVGEHEPVEWPRCRIESRSVAYSDERHSDKRRPYALIDLNA